MPTATTTAKPRQTVAQAHHLAPVTATAPSSESIPEEGALRRHVEAARAGARLTLGGILAIGVVLEAMQERLGIQRGGERLPSGEQTARCAVCPPAWEPIAEQATGYKARWCYNAVRLAREVRACWQHRGETEGLRLLEQASQEQASAPDYHDRLGAVIQAQFEASSFRGLLTEVLGLGQAPEPPASLPPITQSDTPSPADDPPEETPDQLAFDFFGDPAVRLLNARDNPEHLLRALWAIPLQPWVDPRDRQRKPGLLTLREKLEALLEDVRKIERQRTASAGRR